jgi:hypothetical protein
MINNIFIHIGVHKTGSTSIQEMLGRNREILFKYGFLYPVFKARRADLFNHSLPLARMFRKNQENYSYNQLSKFTTQSEYDKLHQRYDEQFKEQISQFEGDTLILSGEDISAFTLEELKKFKSYLIQNSSPKVNIQIIMFCRSPLQRFRSNTVARIRGRGSRLIHETEKEHYPIGYYKKRFLVFSEVFGKEMIKVIRFEDAIRHPGGPAGALLEAIGAATDLISRFKNERHNATSSYEAIAIFSAIHENLPKVNGVPYSFQGKTRKALISLPGQKFALPLSKQRKIWEQAKEDVDWLCETFSLPHYKYEEEEVPAISGRWSQETLKCLFDSMHKLPDPVKKIILEVLLEELNVNKREFGLQKQRQIFGFIMHFSVYLQLGARTEKLKYFVKKLGTVQGMLHSGLYYLSKRSNRLSYGIK